MEKELKEFISSSEIGLKIRRENILSCLKTVNEMTKDYIYKLEQDPDNSCYTAYPSNLASYATRIRELQTEINNIDLMTKILSKI